MDHPEHLTPEEREELVAYLDGELSEEAARAIETRLAHSPAARQEAETLRRTWDMLDFLPRPQVDSTFTNRTLQRVDVQRHTMIVREQVGHWLGRAAWVAGVAAAAIIAFLVSFNWHVISDSKDDRKDLPLPDLSKEDLRLLENWRYFQNIDSIEFLHDLDRADLFGGDS